jgi:hypothetical protein
LEVDFVLYGPGGLLAFEIKRSSRIGASALRGLRAFMRDYPVAQLFLIYGGDRELNEDGIRVLPVEQALRGLPTLLASA